MFRHIHGAEPVRRSVARRAALAVPLVLIVALTGCTAGGGRSDTKGTPTSGPPRLEVPPDDGVGAAMATITAGTNFSLRACDLVGLPVAKVAELTGTRLPGASPKNPGGTAYICTYGGPGAVEEIPSDEAAEGETPIDAAGEQLPDGTTPTVTATEDDETEIEPPAPDTVTAAVVRPPGDPAAALAAQAAQLAARYTCSPVRDPATRTPEGAAPEAYPPDVRPSLAVPYIDCVAGPAGGGTEVHTIFYSNRDLWHLSATKPTTPRNPAAEAEGLAGLHRLANQFVSG